MATVCDRACAVDLDPIVPLAASETSSPQILDYLGYEFLPCAFTSTPLLAQLEWYRDVGPTALSGFFDTAGGTSVLLVISGEEDVCDADEENPDIPALVAALAAATGDLYDEHQIMSFAAGFGDTAGNMADELNAIAANGGTTFSEFWPLDDATDVGDALEQVFDEVASCVFNVESEEATAEPELVNVYLDTELVPYDDECVDGWRWVDLSYEQIELCGMNCDLFLEGIIPGPDGTVGCPTVDY
jgi:hypothetical protein